MKSCQLGLTLSVVGPRAGLLDMPTWPMALRITVGTRDDPDTTEGGWGALVRDTLPWNIWSGDLPDIVIVDQNGHATIATTVPPLPEEAGFLKLLQESVENAGIKLADAGHLSLPYVADHREVIDEDDGVGTPRKETEAIAWPGLLMTVNTLASPTPSAAKSTWYFYMDRSVVAEKHGDRWKLKGNMEISAAPLTIKGASHARTVKVIPPADDTKYPTHLHQYDRDNVEAHCQALKIESVLDHGLDELDNYWLSVRDSRDDSLLDLVNRLEQALAPVTVLGSLSAAELAAACMLRENGQETQALPEDVARFIGEWKKRAGELGANLRTDTDAVVKEALAAGELYSERLRDAYRARVAASLRTIANEPTNVALKPAGADDLAAKAESRLLPQLGSQVKAAAPGEGIELLVGDESLRLRHVDWKDANAIDDIAAIQLFGRRSSNLKGLQLQAGMPDAAPWYCLTASQYALPDGDQPVKGLGRLTGVTVAYSDGVLCRELSYRGANLVARNAMQDAHRERMDADPGSSLMFSRLERLPSMDLLAIPLRYGDLYEFAASVVDRAGGMAPELAPTAPWLWDRETLATLNPPQRDRVQFLRRVPVGECSLRPAVGTSWPQTPENVWLRCLELAESRGEKQDPPTILLVPKGDSYLGKSGTSQRGLPQAYDFIVEPPRVDEHTLMRWDMSATTRSLEMRTATATKLKATVSGILSERDVRMSTDSTQAQKDWSLTPDIPHDYLPFDPAVSKIGLRWEFDGGVSGTLVLPAGMQVVAVREGASNAHVPGNAHFTVGPGNFLRLGICALVGKDDFARMDPDALQRVLDPTGWDAEYVAFAETIVYVETATSTLPMLVFDRIKLRADGVGDIANSYDFTGMTSAEDALYNAVHQAEIKCEQWKWRNLPLPVMDGITVPAEQRARRLASGPPPEIVDEAHRDEATSELVTSFDVLSSIDTGFVLRSSVVNRFPRLRSGDTPIHLDAREGHTHADYLRYSVRLISRYAGVLAESAKSQWTGPRRIATGFRGDARRIKPPQILAVLPLTQAFDNTPVGDRKGGSTQFLVILDESWFREYGIGERLEARVARVKQEIGEKNPPAQRRLGPLPDHSVTPVATLNADEPLDCFGPFGMSLDRTGSQALSNATAFVLYPPEDTPPHYNMFVEFRRVLDLPSGGIPSEYTDGVPMYTLPDTKLLNAGKDGLDLTYTSSGVSFTTPSQFTPFPGAVDGVLTQYRYVLIAGRTVKDGGRAVDVFMPEDVLWLVPGNGPRYEARWLTGSKKAKFGAGIFVEILLNGRFPFPKGSASDTHPLSGASDLRDLFLSMLDNPDRDAPGMIRRVSARFDVSESLLG